MASFETATPTSDSLNSPSFEYNGKTFWWHRETYDDCWDLQCFTPCDNAWVFIDLVDRGRILPPPRNFLPVSFRERSHTVTVFTRDQVLAEISSVLGGDCWSVFTTDAKNTPRKIIYLASEWKNRAPPGVPLPTFVPSTRPDGRHAQYGSRGDFEDPDRHAEFVAGLISELDDPTCRLRLAFNNNFIDETYLRVGDQYVASTVRSA